MKFLALLWCLVSDRPRVESVTKSGRFQGRGDYADEWGHCTRCGGLAHRDTHMFGDAKWHHFEDKPNER